MVLKFLVKYQTLYLLSRDPVIADSSGYLQANFIFSDDWEGTNKTAQFKRTESTLITDGTPLFFNEEIDSNGNCLVPWEVLKGKGTFNVNVFGQKTESDGSTVKTITVNSLDIRVGESGLTTDEIPQDSTASQYDNIYEKILAAEKETQTSQAAAAASQAAAKTSETNAASSASAASTSASAAATSETNAATHETNAKTALASCQNIQSQIAGTYLPLSGGTMTDSIRYVDNGKVFTIGKTRTGNVDICWGWAKREGAGLALRSTDYPSPGEFMLFARDANNSCSLEGKPDGTLTWNSQPLLPVGIVQAFAGTTIPSGWLLCDGSAVSRTTYANLYACIGTTYGAGNGSTTFNLPNLVDKFVEGSATAGTVKSAGLPNITGSIGGGTGAGGLAGHGSGVGFLRDSMINGCFQPSANSYGGETGSGGGKLPSGYSVLTANLDASRSSAIYGKSTTVQPPALTMRYIIKY